MEGKVFIIDRRRIQPLVEESRTGRESGGLSVASGLDVAGGGRGGEDMRGARQRKTQQNQEPAWPR